MTPSGSESLLARVCASLQAILDRLIPVKHVSPTAVRIADDRKFDMRSPAVRNAIDIFYGEWWGSLPSMEFAADCSANMAFYNDIRIYQFNEKIGGFEGKSVLELGPMEAGHSYLMEKFGAANILAIEASTSAFMKCLIVKEILGLKTRFLLGDFGKYLSKYFRVH